ncbi:hypothetical protein Deba_1378 [Desulfarculus baarsii DSM 2075]|uniref:Uncharacterized protein n=1 Tax=Desulfarculus baarsii (strain ATCC 33931 / DSM 2075 / LMG 7858 / VKM B-1802 / 2st14) TaxID=644282 RepID=E1QGQ3_DESB2|nr:hypothetical protein Deba_1378 [Desulfarculus baarsii DSM 2075]
MFDVILGALGAAFFWSCVTSLVYFGTKNDR